MVIQVVLHEEFDKDMIELIKQEAGPNKSAYVRFCLRDYFRKKGMIEFPTRKEEEIPLIRSSMIDSIAKLKKK